MALTLEAVMRTESWYVRLPDGRVVRAKTTESVRHNVERGRIPLDCWVRRSHDDEWQSLEWTSEFADLVRRRNEQAAARLGPDLRDNGNVTRSSHELRTVGVHGLAPELLSALDTALTRPKLLIAAAVGLLCAVTLLFAPLWPAPADFPLVLLPALVTGLIILVLVGVGSALLTQMTFVELSRLRRAQRSEATYRLTRNALRIVIASLLIGGLVVLAIAGLRVWPGWLIEQQADGGELLASLGAVLAIVLEVLLWPVLGLALVIVPIIVIEETGLARALGQWLSLLQQHLGRILLYEALAFALATIAVLPFVLPIVLAGGFTFSDGALLPVKWATLTVLGGLALSPFFAYLVVANVYIYLNLRYETAPTAK